MKRQFAILSISGEPTFSSQAACAAHAQKLANEEGETVVYETESGESECSPQSAWSVGDVYYQAHGTLNGRAWDIGSEPRRTPEEAEQDAADWLSFLSDRERNSADTHVSGYQIDSIYGGCIGGAHSI